MTDQDVLLVATMASLAVAIVLGDLAVSWWRRRPRVVRLRPVHAPSGPSPEEEAAAAAAHREMIRQRLAAIDASMARPDSGQPSATSDQISDVRPRPSGFGSQPLAHRRQDFRYPSGEHPKSPPDPSRENPR